MDRDLAFYMSMSILLPLVVGLIRLKKIGYTNLPLVIMLMLGLINELLSYKLASNAITTNIYALAEILLFCWQFRKWGNILYSKKLFFSLVAVIVAIWSFENILLGQINHFSPIFTISTAIILILIAVNQLNWIIVNERSNILTNYIFIICIAIIIYYSYRVLVEIFYHYAPENVLKNNIFEIEAYINVLYNILLAIALLCIPRKKDFIPQWL